MRDETRRRSGVINISERFRVIDTLKRRRTARRNIYRTRTLVARRRLRFTRQAVRETSPPPPPVGRYPNEIISPTPASRPFPDRGSWPRTNISSRSFAIAAGRFITRVHHRPRRTTSWSAVSARATRRGGV